LSATADYHGPGAQDATASTAVTVPYPSLAAAFDNVGISDDGDPTAASFDGGGYSWSAQALASVGITPGATVPSPDGLSYTWPDVPVATPDNVAASGQVIDLSGSGSKLGFLGAGAFGTQTGTVTVTYADGSTSTGTVTLADWYADAAVSGDVLVATTPHWNIPPGSTLDPDHKVSLYSSAILLDAGKTVVSITLPIDGNLHVFATAFG
jgi:beta-glucosidase